MQGYSQVVESELMRNGNEELKTVGEEEFKRVTDRLLEEIPESYRSAHRQCTGNRGALESSTQAGCFFCLAVFDTRMIKRWVDSETTALCPECGIDSVLPGVVDEKFLREMQKHWFGDLFRD